ncbi:MAG TPA: class I SAM-dependent methyltransferase [Roseiflexaceae bacterium]
MKSADIFSILHSPFYIRIIRWAFDRFYHEFAWTYDAVAAAVSGGRWGAWGRSALPYLHGRVLELGCGTGALQSVLAGRMAAASVGVDASTQMLDITMHKLNRAGRPIRLARAVAQALPFLPATFDSIAATFPTDYIADRATLAEARRVLRPQGHLVIVLAAAFAQGGPYQRLVDLAYRLTLQPSPRVQLDRPPRSAIADRLTQAGFAVEERWESVMGDRVHLVIGTRV